MLFVSVGLRDGDDGTNFFQRHRTARFRDIVRPGTAHLGYAGMTCQGLPVAKRSNLPNIGLYENAGGIPVIFVMRLIAFFVGFIAFTISDRAPLFLALSLIESIKARKFIKRGTEHTLVGIQVPHRSGRYGADVSVEAGGDQFVCCRDKGRCEVTCYSIKLFCEVIAESIPLLRQLLANKSICDCERPWVG